jgi:hypothetical protein
MRNSALGGCSGGWAIEGLELSASLDGWLCATEAAFGAVSCLPVHLLLTSPLAFRPRSARFLAPPCSGTLSYIFNELAPGKAFSEVVWGARRRGYTEPDPRDDLSGALAGPRCRHWRPWSVGSPRCQRFCTAFWSLARAPSAGLWRCGCCVLLAQSANTVC